MPVVREENCLMPIPLRNVVPTIPKHETWMKILAEDLTWMGCEGLLLKFYNLQDFLFE